MNRMGKKFLDRESGGVAVIVMLLLVVGIGFTALALDYGHLVYVKRELTKAAEAGALSGARGLWPPDFSVTPFPAPWTNRDPNWYNGYVQALATAAKNLSTPSTDVITVETGRWDYVNTFTVTQINPNGVRVTIRRNNVPTTFAQLLSQTPISIGRSATAIMDWTNAVPGGSLPIAVNLDEAQKVGDPIKIGLNPATSDNGGWFTVPPTNPSTPNLLDYIRNQSCPPMSIGDSIALNNGTVVPVLDELYTELAVIQTSHPEGWDVVVPVVTTDQFNQTDKIVSFVNIRITEVIAHGSPKFLQATILALGGTQSGNPGPPGPSGPTGVLAPPRLVQ
ncbi:MAG TPA: TadE/TadG family type IV pilus assembly protein [Desulfobaccales bacterium]|nr:TadE/TadG family type IV pilus assembly protein [Desulfobaccales bacterium]